MARLFLVLLGALAVRAALGQIALGDDFEHKTQASTGQTTGVWLVHFRDAKCEACSRISAAMAEYNPDGAEEVVLMAEVDADKNPDVAKRFSVERTPALLLFRDRKMYRHPNAVRLVHGSGEEDLAADLAAFAAKPGVAAEDVPAEPSQIDAMLATLRKWAETEFSGGTARAVGFLLAGIGAIMVLVVFLLIIMGGSKRKQQ